MLLSVGYSILPWMETFSGFLPWVKLAFEDNNPLVVFPLAFILLVIFLKMACKLMLWEYVPKTVVKPSMDGRAWTRNFSPHGGRNEKSDSSPRRPTRRRG